MHTDDEKPPAASSSANAAPVTAAPAKPAPHTFFLDRFQELSAHRWCFPGSDRARPVFGALSGCGNCVFSFPVCSTGNEVLGLLRDYLLNQLPLDIENMHKGAAALHHLRCSLGTACQGLQGSGIHTLTDNNEPKLNLEFFPFFSLFLITMKQ